MKKTSLVLLICIAFISAEASIIEDLISKTRLRGKLDVDTSKGIDLDYKGGIHYDDNLIKIDILNFGAKASAVAQDPSTVGNTTVHKIAYNGGFDVTQGDHKAHVTATGTAGFAGDVQVIPDNKTNTTQVVYKKTLTNDNGWNVTAGDYFVGGTHDGELQAEGKLLYNKGNIHHIQKIQGKAVTEGLVTANGTNVGTFAALKAGSAVIDKNIKITEENGTSKFTLWGKGVFNKKGGFKWNNDTWVDGVQGQANFAGVGGGAHNQDENGTHAKGLIKKNVNYQYGAVWGKNGKINGSAVTRGKAIIEKGFKYDGNDAGTRTLKVANIGNLAQYTQGKMKDEPDNVDVEIIGRNDFTENFKRLGIDYEDLTEEALEQYNETLFNEPLSKDPKANYQGILNATWKSGAVINANPLNDLNGTAINVTTGAKWALQGKDNVHGDWKKEGNKTAEGFWQVINDNNNTKRVENIKASIDKNDEFLEKLDRVATFIHGWLNRFNLE